MYCGSRNFPVSQSIDMVTKHLVCLDTNTEEGKIILIRLVKLLVTKYKTLQKIRYQTH